jgi:hypothetical protein
VSTKPDAEERRIRAHLRELVDGPDTEPDLPAEPPRLPDGYGPRERDWLDDILDAKAPKPEPIEEPEAAEPEPTDPATPATPENPKARKTRRKRPRRHDPAAPRSAWDSQPPAPRQSLIEAWDRVPYRLKWLAYHAAAGYLGWSVGLVDWTTYVTAWIFANGFGPQTVFWCLAAAATFLLHHRTRSWWWPLAWLAAVPATSTVVGVLLYGTPHS